MTTGDKYASMNIRLAIISHMFPSVLNPSFGKFVKDQSILIQQHSDSQIKLFVPTPFSIPFTKRYSNNNSPLISDKVEAQRVNYVSFPRKKLASLIRNFLSNTLSKAISSEHFDLFHFHSLYPDGLFIPKLKKKGAKVVLTMHGSDWYKNIHNSALMQLLYQSLANADKILLVGSGLFEEVKKTYPELSPKLFLIGNFIDEDQYLLPSENSRMKAKQLLNWDPSKLHFVSVSNFKVEKGLDVLLDSIQNNNFEGLNIQFHIVGVTDSKLPEKYKNIPSVSFYKPVSPRDLIQFYYAGDAFVSPSRREGFGLALIEAAACGLPLVATSTGIASSFVNEHVGVLCTPNSIDNLASAIKILSEKIHTYSSDEIRSLAVSEFGKYSFSRKLFNQYSEVLNQ